MGVVMYLGVWWRGGGGEGKNSSKKEEVRSYRPVPVL